jgi:DNA adenine methylase
MEQATHPIRPATKFPGGKFYMHRRLVTLMPPHECYICASGGMASDLLNKPRATVEIYNDLDWFNWNLMTTLRDDGDEFLKRVRKIPYDREVFVSATRRHLHRYANWLADGKPQNPKHFRSAVDTYIYRRMSRGGRGVRSMNSAAACFAWSERMRGGRPGDMNAWETSNVTNLPRVIDRTQGVTTMNKDANLLYQEFGEFSEVLVYDDPPYMKTENSERTTSGLYEAMEMTPAQHVRRLELACKAKCMVMISGYDHNLYRAFLGNGRGLLMRSGRPGLFGFEDWRCRRFSMPNNLSESKSKSRRIECVWMNFEPACPELEDDPLDARRPGMRYYKD